MPENPKNYSIDMDSMDSKKQKEKEFAKEEEQMQRLCFAVFGTDSGKKLLDYLIHYFIHNRIIANPHHEASMAFFNEGQNYLIRQLEQAYNAGKTAAENENNQKKR